MQINNKSLYTTKIFQRRYNYEKKKTQTEGNLV